MPSADGIVDMVGWGDEDQVQYAAMQRLGIFDHHWSPAEAIGSKQSKTKKRAAIRLVRKHNAREIARAEAITSRAVRGMAIWPMCLGGPAMSPGHCEGRSSPPRQHERHREGGI